MKRSLLIASIFLASFVLSTCAMAQASASATASATIVAPISITKTINLNFGNVATNGTVGTVTLTAGGVRSSTGGVTLPATNGTVTAASFTVGGSGVYTYAITLPSAAVTITSGLNTMTVDTFTSTPITTGTLSAGTQTLTVGATLNLGVSQAAGLYTATDIFAVTVNYN
jgi:hypothetical protein